MARIDEHAAGEGNISGSADGDYRAAVPGETRGLLLCVEHAREILAYLSQVLSHARHSRRVGEAILASILIHELAATILDCLPHMYTAL